MELQGIEKFFVGDTTGRGIGRLLHPLSSFCSMSAGGGFLCPISIISAAESHENLIMLCSHDSCASRPQGR